MKTVLAALALCLGAAPAMATPAELMSPEMRSAITELFGALNADTPAQGVTGLDAVLSPSAEFREAGQPISRAEWLQRQTDGYIYNARMVVEDAFWTGNRLIVVQKAQPLKHYEPGPCCPTESSFVTTYQIDAGKVVLVEASGPINRLASGIYNG
ncbi:hypothetical protein [Croceibacterium ferulae]|uniref:hypothetical protein n=1 Tax=Croceibacterium ferulae TaxID=1854641 RepID=UPI000EB58E7E|nr:hypothetical protein [Croceibacterium ferulae]